MEPFFYAVAVATIDGKIARHSRHFTDWSSKEDKDFLRKKMDEADAIIVGNNTFELAREPLSKRMCIVFTSSVAGTKKESENLLYCNPGNLDIKKLVSGLGHQRLCVLGGGKTYSHFLENGLLDEIFLTIEPIVFGSGINLFDAEINDTKYALVSVEKLNKHGAVLLHYKK